ncbi:MAG: ABC transporter ATP-binding protein [Sedimentisphaerales bacterium]|nr:ABC transporter ATP-binding protein [Sedimentisphaerales bacterium]
MTRIQLHSLSKCFDKTIPALQDVSLAVDAGELMVIVGPSGSGKTTLLRIIAGLEAPDTGSLHFDEQDMTAVEPRQRNVAMVFQEGNLYPHLSVRDNMAFPLKARRMSVAEIDKAVHNAAQLLHIEDLLDRRPYTLSAGQRGRVALGRAMVREPAVFLLDEPLANLDVELRHRMRSEIRSLQHSLGATMIYVTHDQNEAMSLADRICVLRDGVVQQIGSPLEIYQRPANRFVGGFFGNPSMNFIDGQIKEEAAACLFVSSPGTIRFPVAFAKTVKKYNDCEVVLGIRPEDVTIITESSQQNVIPVKIQSLEMLGREVVVTAESMAGKPLVCLASPDTPLTINQSVQLQIDPSKIHLFEAGQEGRCLTV